MAELDRYVAAVDVGTTTLRCCLFNQRGKMCASADSKLTLLYLEPMRVEMDPEELWSKFTSTIKAAITNCGCTPSQVTAMGICCQRNTFITWDRQSGDVFHNFSTWKDLSATDLTDAWNRSLTVKAINYFGALMYFITRQSKFLLARMMKILNALVLPRFLNNLEKSDVLRAKLASDDLVYGCMETWLVYRLSGKTAIVTEPSLASATGLFDSFTMDWARPLFGIFGFPGKVLPSIQDTAGYFATCEPHIFGAEIPITALMGDQQAATFGCGCYHRGAVSVTLGTGSFVDMNTGDRPHVFMNGIYPIVGWSSKHMFSYLAEASANDTATAINWAQSIGLNPTLLAYQRKTLFTTDLKVSGLFHSIEGTAEIAESVPNSGGVFFVPAFGGLQAPVNDDLACAMFIGLKPDTTKAHMVRAILESLAFRVYQMFGVMRAEASYDISVIRCCGGVSNNEFVCQLVADLCDQSLERMSQPRFVPAKGVALLAGMAVGLWKNENELLNMCQIGRTFYPSEDGRIKQDAMDSYRRWIRAVDRSRKWYSGIEKL